MAAATTSIANRIGLGVDLENGESVLGTLRQILEAEKEIVRVAGRSSGTAARTASSSSTNRAQAAKTEATAVAQAEVSAKRQALDSFDRMSAAAAQKERRRITDSTDHAIREGRRLNDTMAYLARQTDEQLKSLYGGHKAANNPVAQDIAQEIERRVKGRRDAAGGSLDPNTAENQAILARARNPDPNRYVHDPRRGDAAAQAAAREAASQASARGPQNQYLAMESAVERGRRIEEAARRSQIRAGLRSKTQPEGFTDEEEARTGQLVARLKSMRGLPARRQVELDKQAEELNRLYSDLERQQKARAPAGEGGTRAAGRDPEMDALREQARRRRAAQTASPQQEDARRRVAEAQFEGQFGGARSTLDKARDSLTRFQKEADSISLRHLGSEVGIEAGRMSKDLLQARKEAAELRKEISTPANMHRTAQEVEKDLAGIDRKIVETQEKLRGLRLKAAEDPGTFSPQGRFGGDNPFGALATAQRIGRNLLIYAAVRGFTTDLKEFITTSLQAAQAAEETQRQLQFTSKAAHVSFEGNLKVADSIRKELFLSRRLADEAVAESTQLASEANRPADIEGITRAITDINAKRGRGVEKIAENIRAVTVGGRGYQELLGVKPDELYQREAERRVTTSEQAGQPYRDENTNRLLSHTEAVKKMVAALSDEEKVSLRINEVLRQGNEVQGAAAARANTAAGRIEIMNQKWEDAKVAVGNFVLSLTPVVGLLTKISSLITGIDPGRLGLQGTGQGGQITAADIARNAHAYPDSAAYRASQFLSQQGPTLLGGAAVAGAGLFFGRGPARAERQQQVFRRTFAEGTDLGLTPELARAEAQSVAQSARPGMFRSIGVGLRNITEAITTTTLDLTSKLARSVGAEGIANRFQASAQRIRAGVRDLEGTVNERATKYASRGSVIGGLTGGIVGAQIGAMVAEKLNVGPITATLLTITGGIIGTAAGTALGNTVGGAIGAQGGLVAAAAAHPAIAAGIAVAAIGYLGIDYFTRKNNEYAARQEAITGATNRGLLEQKAQLEAARQEGRSYFRERGIGGYDAKAGQFTVDPNANLTKRYTKQEVDDLVAKGGNRAKFEEVIETPEMTTARTRREGQAKEEQDRNDKDSAEFWEKIRQEEAKRAEELIHRQEAALGKLRDFVKNSYQVIGTIAEANAPDNPFVKIFSDGATAAERMKQEYGFLGDATVKYFTDLESRAGSIKLIAAEFENLAKVQSSTMQASREGRERRGPDLSSYEKAQLDVTNAQLNAAKQIPELYERAAKVLGIHVDHFQIIQRQVALIQRDLGLPQPEGRQPGSVAGTYLAQRDSRGRFIDSRQVGAGTPLNQNIPGFTAGERQASFIGPDGKPRSFTMDVGQRNDYLAYDAAQQRRAMMSPEARRASDRAGSAAIVEILGQIPPEVLRRNPALAQTYVGALSNQAGGLQQDVTDARARAEILAQNNADVTSAARAAADKRNEMIRAGRDPNEVARQYDKTVLGLTSGIPVKDLSPDAFQARQDAFKREAERAGKQEEDARKAVEEAQKQRAEMLDVAKAIRDAVLGGNMSVLVQVTNDTDARTDTEALQDANADKPGKIGYPTAKPSMGRYGK
jgi:hypothetical protein